MAEHSTVFRLFTPHAPCVNVLSRYVGFVIPFALGFEKLYISGEQCLYVSRPKVCLLIEPLKELLRHIFLCDWISMSICLETLRV